MQNLQGFPVIPRSVIMSHIRVGNYIWPSMKYYFTTYNKAKMEEYDFIPQASTVRLHHAWQMDETTRALLPFSTGAEKLQRKVHPVLLILGQSAFTEVHFCISEHTNPTDCSNTLSLPLSGSSWQRPSSSTVWSPVFSLIWVVKVRLLEAVYFTAPTKKAFFFFLFPSDND